MKHISDIKKYSRCARAYWLSKNTNKEFFPYIYYNENILDLTKKHLNIKKYFNGNKGDKTELALNAISNEEQWLVNPRFDYHNLRIRISIMEKRKYGYNIYFLFNNTHPKESEATTIADQIWVLKHLGIKIEEIKLIHLSSDYIRIGELEIDKLLKVSDYFYTDKNTKGNKVSKAVKKKYRDLDPILLGMDEVLEKGTLIAHRSNICTRRNKCDYFEDCFPNGEKDTSILNLVQSSNKFNMYEEGIDDIKNVNLDLIEGTRHQYAQIIAAKNNELFFDKYVMKNWVNKKIIYPISYLDFEWETYAYPPFDMMKPMDVLVFQYSLHIEDKEYGNVIHKQYLGKKDCRVDFIEHLLNDLPTTGSIMVFNADGGEKLRLKQLAIQFPEYKDKLKTVWERMVDLSIPFSSGNIYDTRMQGMFSLKKLVNIVSNFNYETLDISHGMEAVRAWRLLDHLTLEESKKIEEELFEYCAMDTKSMIIVFHWILEKLQVN
ncbi:MAG: DUF2779 domain-containing protein [Erysipelotrichaceae bacterium]